MLAPAAAGLLLIIAHTVQQHKLKAPELDTRGLSVLHCKRGWRAQAKRCGYNSVFYTLSYKLRIFIVPQYIVLVNPVINKMRGCTREIFKYI